MSADSTDAAAPSSQGDDGVPPPVDISKSQWDQLEFEGRLKRFAQITNPLLLLKSHRQLEDAKKLVDMAKEGHVPRGTTAEQLYAAKVLYDSAYHPDTGEKMKILGRMSAQMPAGMVITGILLAYYKTFLQVFGSQWINQSFNALVNYTNRNAKSEITNRQILTAYVGATSGAVAVSVGMNSLVKRAPQIVRRWVPFTAVAAANCINIPVMRQQELFQGVVVTDEEENVLGKSRVAAAKGISQVCCSRIFMAAPGMLLTPILMQRLERYPFFSPSRRGKAFSAVIQALFCGVCLIFTVPVGCALFPQQSSLRSRRLEKSLREKILSERGVLPERVYFNKGL